MVSPPKPSTVRVPFNPAFPLSTPLRQNLQSALIHAGSVPTISSALNTECTNTQWQIALKDRVIQMLKSGDFENRRELVAAIVTEARGLPREEEGEDSEGRRKGLGRIEGGGEVVDIRIPQKATREALKVVRDALEGIVEIEPEKGFWD